jgi:hypothetical protein
MLSIIYVVKMIGFNRKHDVFEMKCKWHIYRLKYLEPLRFKLNVTIGQLV